MFCGLAHSDSLNLTRTKPGKAEFDASQNGPASQVGLEHEQKPYPVQSLQPSVSIVRYSVNIALQSKRFMRAPLTSKLCAEVWKTGYERSLNSENENSKLEMGTPKFPAKIDFKFHRKSSSLQSETSDFGPDFLFSFLVFVSE